MDKSAEIKFDERQYSSLMRELKTRAGVSLEGYRPKVAQRRLARRLRKIGVEAPDDYLAYVRKNPDEAKEIINFVTVSVGRFFRNREVFDRIEYKTLPAIFSSAKPNDAIVVWSAGCGEGEEIYSLAMILSRRFAGVMADRRVRLIASDVNRASLEKARVGRYDVSKTVEAPPWMKSRYLRKRGNAWEVTDEIKRMVEFRWESLPESRGAPGSDLIMFRNLLIYFDRDRQDALFGKVFSCLKPGGFLALGKSETLPLKFKREFDVASGYDRIYRKALS